MKYQIFNPEKHDPEKIAQYVYEVDFRTFNLLFKTPEKAIKKISKNLKPSQTFLIILDDNENIIGILEYYMDNFPKDFTLKSLRLLIIDILDYFTLSDVKKGDLYIADIAIDKSLRGQGIGSKVIEETIEYAKENNMNRVTLDADFKNTQAKKLYEKLGFHQYNKKRVKIGSLKEECIIWN